MQSRFLCFHFFVKAFYVYAYVCVMPLEAELFSDRASNVIMSFQVGESRGHLSIEADRVETAMLDLFFGQFVVFQIIDEPRVGLAEYKTVMTNEVFSVFNYLF